MAFAGFEWSFLYDLAKGWVQYPPAASGGGETANTFDSACEEEKECG
jgi:hypothetical protein